MRYEKHMAGRTVQDLIPYLKREADVGKPCWRAYSVKEQYLIEYRGQPVAGCTEEYLSFRDAYGGIESQPLAELDWGRVHIYKKMNNW